MSGGLPIGFGKLYEAALQAHLMRSGEKALHQAYELGRQALAEGLGVLDVTLLHHEALSRFMFEKVEDDAETLEYAAEFLAHCLSPYEMSLRGYQEANSRLRTANEALTRAHEQLKAEVEERRKAEEALLHAKKLQAVGLLAGGVAHHFNNLLTVVLGNLELVRQNLQDERSQRLLLAARRGAERGAEVTRQLLSFSRQQILQPRVVDPAGWLADITPWLSSTLRGDIMVETQVEGDVRPIMVDPSQLELAILNLAVNARDAMPAGGTLRITISNRRMSDGRLGLDGDYVAIEVADTGQGVPAELLPRVFEPFFSTKQSGPGAGLGLSQVHGFTHQSGGAVEMENAPDKGAVVRLYLPVAVQAAVQATAAAGETAAADAKQHSGHILVVEDDADVALVACDLLESLGYSVTCADRIQSALDVIESGEPIDLIFSDVVMPGGMNGVQLAEEVRDRFPRLPVLLTTGYNDTLESMGASGLAFIAKPYRAEELRQRIDALLQPGGNGLHSGA